MFTHGENVGAHHGVSERVVSVDYIFPVHANVVVVGGEREALLEDDAVECAGFVCGELTVFADVVAAASAEEQCAARGPCAVFLALPVFCFLCFVVAHALVVPSGSFLAACVPACARR